MMRGRKWAWRVTRGLAVAGLVVLLLWVGLGGTVFGRIFAARIEGLGLARPDFRVSGYTLAHLDITRVSVGQDDRLRAGSVGIDFSLFQALRGRVDSIEIVGLEAEIRRRGGVWDFGPLADLHGPGDGETPFRRIALRASTLTLDLDGRRVRIPISGSVQNAGANSLAMDLATVVEGVTLRLTGTLDAESGDFALALAGEAPDLGRVLAVLAPSIATAAGGPPVGGLAGKVVVARRQGALDLDATLVPADLAIPASGAALKGLSANLRMAASTGADGLRVDLLPDSWIALASAEVPAGGGTMAAGPARFLLKTRENQPLLNVTLEDGRPVTAVAALTIEEADPITPRGTFRFSAGEGTTATLATTGAVVEGAWNDKGVLLAGSLRVGGIDVSLRHKFGDQLLAADVRGASLRVTARRDGPGAPLPIEFVVRTPPGSPGVSASVAGAKVAAGTAEVRGTVTLADGAPPAVSARVSLTDASVQHKEVGLAVAGLGVDMPLTWNVAAPPEPGRLAVKSFELQGVILPPLSGTLSLAGTRADFTVACEPLHGAKLRVEGSAALGTGSRGPSVRATLSLPLFELADEEALGRLVPPLKGLLATGSFALDGYVRLSPEGLSPNIALTILDGRFSSKAWQADAEGVFATVRVNSLAPLLTPRKEFQVALVRRATMGKLDVKDGFVAFRLEPKEADGRPNGWTAYVQRGEWGWVGGRLFVEDFRFDPQAREHTTTVFARDLKLGALLALIPNERATGVGSLDGKLAVTIGKWPDIRFGEGELRTAPGESGWFKVKDTEPLGAVLESTDPRFKTDSRYVEIKKRLVNAFKDFEYDELNVVLTRDGGGDKSVARVTTKGRARTGERQEFDAVNLNFLGFDELLRSAILISRGVQELKRAPRPGEGEP